MTGTPQASAEKLRWRKEQMTYRASTDVQERPRGDDTLHDSHLEGHFATEASFVVLDTLERCVSTIALLDSQQHLVGLALSVLLHALGKNQSTTVLPHMFASQRSLVFKVRVFSFLKFLFKWLSWFSFTAPYLTKRVLIARTYVFFY